MKEEWPSVKNSRRKMARDGCINGTLDDAKYSSPMPIIGLYIAAATSVCCLAILFDIISGLRSRKRWLPCRFFSLNSVILTLLAIAAKIPVDLTTKMPSAHDQLSKLSGTTLMCVCMGFLMPSIGINRESESWTNMLALSILIVTIAVNICIQMYTGVIVLFRVEHIIILCCMAILLLALFSAAFDINSQKRASVDQNKDLLRKRGGSMLERLKVSYLYAYHSNPQLELCKDVDSVLVAVLCIVSLFVLVQAVFRSFILRKTLFLCDGSSDYQWSIWVILATQVVTTLVGGLGTSFRLVTLVPHMNLNTFGLNWASKDIDVINDNPLLHIGKNDARIGMAINVIYFAVACIEVLIFLPSLIVGAIWKRCCGGVSNSEEIENNDIEEYLHLIRPGEKGLEEWTLRMGVRDMNKWMELNKNNAPNYNINRLLYKSPLSEESLINQFKGPAARTYNISSLTVVLLVRIASVCLPSTVSASLSTALGEVFEVIHFVEKKMGSTSFDDKRKFKLAKAALQGPNSRDDLLRIFKIRHIEEMQLNLSLNQAIAIFKRLKDELPYGLVREELCCITNFIVSRNFVSIEELYGLIEQLFTEMLHEFLSQLPNAIIKEINESNPEDYEDVIRLSLKLLCKVESLEAFVQWSYPIGTGIKNLIKDNNELHEA